MLVYACRMCLGSWSATRLSEVMNLFRVSFIPRTVPATRRKSSTATGHTRSYTWRDMSGGEVKGQREYRGSEMAWLAGKRTGMGYTCHFVVSGNTNRQTVLKFKPSARLAGRRSDA